MEEQLVVFKVGATEYGVSINNVQEIIRIPQSTKIPNVPDYVEGVINLRGNIIPVINLRKRFGVETVGKDEDSRIVVLELANQTVGVIVDEVSEVLKIPHEAIEPPSKIMNTGANSVLEGIGKIDQRLLFLLNVEAILLSDEWNEQDFSRIQKEIEKIDEKVEIS